MVCVPKIDNNCGDSKEESITRLRISNHPIGCIEENIIHFLNWLVSQRTNKSYFKTNIEVDSIDLLLQHEIFDCKKV